ncbi:hypothetical protein KAFR_0B04360 [Kazachstania africana CBS 2517]|uniref:Mitochondrial pyruvate carrier n=1 Tax=Kazachstania africana (strain ATCC 22294 / BCRC 22015 / CBS 2517 / CECT 1963 / NBRC 1671 / NRRL Y-8276) TaxID=1071382 RepID=H2AQT2_KAZAF|nr:hypothetical protein KAFR_0B04360 [Kazachstania africana CBS 2517]CCF56732.1 hypothetical protein KAFR_0B04360 [Kazachstania africana CBS 2517]
MSTIGIAFKRFWNSQTGPKTVHFWAPALKWSLVFAGINDIKRPVNKVSGTQSLSLMATGLVWTRWSFVIIPKNYLLASVNFFLAGTAGYQVMRLINYRLDAGDSMKQVFKYIITSKPDTVNQIEDSKNVNNRQQNTQQKQNEITH